MPRYAGHCCLRTTQKEANMANAINQSSTISTHDISSPKSEPAQYRADLTCTLEVPIPNTNGTYKEYAAHARVQGSVKEFHITDRLISEAVGLLRNQCSVEFRRQGLFGNKINLSNFSIEHSESGEQLTCSTPNPNICNANAIK